MAEAAIDIRKLTPSRADDYVRFFDATPHADGKEEHKCYCVWWCGDDSEGKDFSSVEKRRDYALRCVKNNSIQGYLAYCDDEVVGWCNANTKSDCLKCYCWRRFMGSVPVEEPGAGIRVKSIFCFAIAPGMKRRGIARRFVERVCRDAAEDGFDFVEAYPNKEFIDEEEDFMGPAEMFLKSGFAVHGETEQKFIVRKRLK